MLKQYLIRPSVVFGIIGLLVGSLILAACGGSGQPTSAVSTAPVEAEDTPDISTDTQDEIAADSPPAENESVVDKDTPTPATETMVGESETVPVNDAAECKPADPNEDPIAGVTEYVNEYIEMNLTNDAIPTVSDSDWAKGPADAPVTIIEYGDFQ